MAIIILLSVLLFAIVRKTSVKRYTSLIFVLFTIKASCAIILAQMNILPSFFTDKLDSNKLAIALVTYYIGATGIAPYDFKVNLFI